MLHIRLVRTCRSFLPETNPVELTHRTVGLADSAVCGVGTKNSVEQTAGFVLERDAEGVGNGEVIQFLRSKRSVRRCGRVASDVRPNGRVLPS